MHPNLFRMNCEIGRGSDEEYRGCLWRYQNPFASCAVPECLSLWCGSIPEQGAPGLIGGRMNGACVLQQQCCYSGKKQLLSFNNACQAAWAAPGCTGCVLEPASYNKQGKLALCDSAQICCGNLTYYCQR